MIWGFRSRAPFRHAIFILILARVQFNRKCIAYALVFGHKHFRFVVNSMAEETAICLCPCPYNSYCCRCRRRIFSSKKLWLLFIDRIILVDFRPLPIVNSFWLQCHKSHADFIKNRATIIFFSPKLNAENCHSIVFKFMWRVANRHLSAFHNYSPPDGVQNGFLIEYNCHELRRNLDEWISFCLARAMVVLWHIRANTAWPYTTNIHGVRTERSEFNTFACSTPEHSDQHRIVVRE